MKRIVHDELIYYQFDNLAVAPDLYHGVFTRAGGVSRPPFESLNLSRSVGDDAAAVTENNRRMLAAFDMRPDQATTAWLVHGRSVAVVGRADAGHYRANVDAIITRERGLALTMRFADCVPVIVYDRVRGALGLAHAGWRGVAVNVVAATLDAMREAFGSDPREAWVGIGPCISVDKYRVGPDVFEAVAAACPANTSIAQRQPDGSVHLDLNAAVAAQLRACGVTHIEDSQLCTATRTDEWFSHRAEQGKTGRFGVVIGLQWGQSMDLRENLQQVQDLIAAAAVRAGRDPASITLVAVSKTQPAEAVVEAYHLGVRHFGENRVEEATLKQLIFRQRIFDLSVTFHMIGHVQSRKAEEVVAWSDRVHSVDSVKLAQRLDRFAAAQPKVLPILLEVNVSGEASKYGFDAARRDELFGAVEVISSLTHIRLDGLMTMAPLVAEAELARPVFRGLRGLRDEIEARYAGVKLPQLSMGMTDDFEVAIEEGATLVRVGRAIFGERQTVQG